jgi:hypothetical protein
MSKFQRLCALSLLVVYSVWAGENRVPWTSVDKSWYHPPQSDDFARFRKAAPLPDSAVIEVTPAQLARAEKVLRQAPSIGISSQRASAFVGRNVESVDGQRWYLIRAVCLNRGTGAFSVTQLGHDVLVEHGSLGRSAVPMQRQALVVRLPERPGVVFTSCSMAE